MHPCPFKEKVRPVGEREGRDSWPFSNFHCYNSVLLIIFSPNIFFYIKELIKLDKRNIFNIVKPVKTELSLDLKKIPFYASFRIIRHTFPRKRISPGP